MVDGVDEFATQVSSVGALGALAEPARRALYLFVAAQADAVSREQAADGCDLPLHTVKFHLDRLVEEGLLEVEFRRLSGRAGPGAGRPSKLYRRSRLTVNVSLPERRYDIAGGVLAAAIGRSLREGVALQDAVADAAEVEGRRIAAEAQGGSDLERAADVLGRHGYEPRTTGGEIHLANCPFDALACEHAALVCGMNLALVGGVLKELNCRGLEAVLDPEPGLCCVKAQIASQSAGERPVGNRQAAQRDADLEQAVTPHHPTDQACSSHGGEHGAVVGLGQARDAVVAAGRRVHCHAVQQTGPEPLSLMPVLDQQPDLDLRDRQRRHRGESDHMPLGGFTLQLRHQAPTRVRCEHLADHPGWNSG